MLKLAALLACAFLVQSAPSATARHGASATLRWSGVSGALRATDERNGWELEIAPPGLRLVPCGDALDPRDEPWSFEIGTATFGREYGAHPVRPGAPVATGNRVDIAHDGLIEWFISTAHGIEHGWTIPSRPEGDDEPGWIGLRVEGNLTMRLVDDGSGAFLVDRRGDVRLIYGWIKAWDANGNPVQAELAPGPWGVGVRFHDRDAVYPVTIDPLLYSGWAFEPDQASAAGNCGCIDNGLRTRTAGDVNGDGYSDIIIGSALFDGPAGADEGRVWVFHGGPLGPNPAYVPDWTANGGSAGGRFGIGAAGVGDVNGDGFDDIVATARLHGNGTVYVWYGSPTGLGPNGTPANAAFAWQSTVGACELLIDGPAGDLNGDGFDDIALGCPTVGRVIVFFGSAAGIVLSATNPWINAGNPVQAGSQFGSRVTGAGDVNADGFADLAVSAPFFNNGGGADGKVFLYLGSAGFAADPNPDTVISGTGGEQLGRGLAGVGDTNGDGYADLAIGAPEHGGRGKVHVHHGTVAGLSATPAASREWPGPGSQQYGFTVAAGGDLDSDGFGDIVVGAPLAFGNQGAIYVTHGQPGMGFVASAGDDQYLGGTMGIQLGHDLGCAGDVNGDGFTDIVASAAPFYSNPELNEGVVRLFFGKPQMPFLERRTTYNGVANAETGKAVAYVGDLNGDGFTDWAIGDPGFDGAFVDQGRVRVYLGQRGSPPGSSTFQIHGGQAGARLGSAISGGDLNNDGFGDLAVGAPGWSNGEAAEGRVLVFLGNASGISTTAAWTYEGNEVNAEVGRSVSAEGDVNRDGFADLLVGSRALGGVDRGSVRLFLGTGSAIAADILPAAPNWQRQGDVSGVTTYGISVSFCGDLNRDGYTDFVVGSPDVSNSHAQEGRIYAYLGGSSGPSTGSAAWLEESNSAGARLGTRVGHAGDINGDGFSDLFATAPGYAALAGAVYIYRGAPGGPSTITLPLQWFTTGAAPGDEFGRSAAGGGDMNGDGFSDFAVGVARIPSSTDGAVHVFMMGSAGLPTVPSETYAGTPSVVLGEALSITGDVNGDGLADLLTSGGVLFTGNVHLFIAGGGTGLGPAVSQRRQDDSRAIQILGRSESVTGFGMRSGSFNQQGLPSTPMGRERVRVQYETKPLGGLLNGSGLVLSGGWINTGSLSTGNPTFSVILSGLPSLDSYRWRQRFLLHNPHVPFTRWLTLPGNSRQETKVGLGTDCNANGRPDADDIALGSSLDCNGNQIPDECDIASGTSLDCNNNQSPDECDLFGNDCNLNGIPDECEIDCNGNFQPDSCDIALGFSQDTNGDGVPDECQGATALFCPGDGSGTACPCANSSPAGAQDGCLNSLGTGGRLRVTGVPRVSFDNLTLLGTQMPNSSALYFQGTGQQGGGNGSVFGDGLRCASGSVTRLGTKVNAGGASQYPVAGDLSISVRGLLPAAGGTRTYQVWYRNAAAFCTVSTFNLTNGISVQWVP